MYTQTYIHLNIYIYIYLPTQLDVERGLNIVSISFVGDNGDDYVIGNTNEAKTEKYCCVKSATLLDSPLDN